MEKFYNQIKNSPVFFGINEDELKEMLECFNARIKSYDEGEMIIRQGDMITNIYLVLEGTVNIEKDSYWGRRIIVSQLGVNDNIALAFVASKNIESSIDAVAATKAKLLLLSYQKCTTMCQNVCTKHKLLINNLFEILSKENIELIQKIENKQIIYDCPLKNEDYQSFIDLIKFLCYNIFVRYTDDCKAYVLRKVRAS